MLFHSNGPMHRLKASLLNGSSKMNQLSITKKHKEKTDETHLSGRTLRGEIKMERGPCTSEAINQNGAEILYQNGKLTATSSPKQRLIDKILARRKVEQFFKEEEHHAQNRKLEEVKESLKKELFKHQLQKSHLEGEFIIPSCKHDHPGALQARIVEIRNNLPAMEDRIQKLRLRVSKDHEKKVISHNEDSVHEGAEPYQIRNINMVQLILNDMVEKLMDDYIQKVPGGMDSSSADNLAQKNMQEAKRLMKEVKTNRVTSLVMEQIVLEVTYELSNEAAEEIYSVNQMSRSLAFDVIFNAVQRKESQIQKPNEHLKHTGSSDHLLTLLLEQQKDRELHRKGLWGSNSRHPTPT
ncbi:uncharacterized protein LOC129697647 isoform X2 [Leucoraja erinacea]|uniref:uncharacterized protein LOC129697647 isoform X2 n=1 Tax=Leucoraja erinaceus TaxID=7782 RepID=UPI00245523A2|nr:uncharacterized protein LOC129697647 isoform X2 [Leucoraja erinacea]